jgi:hypothetical protein
MLGDRCIAVSREAALVTRRVSEGQNTTYNNPSLTHRVTKAPPIAKVSAIRRQPMEGFGR